MSTRVKGADLQGAPRLPCRAGSDGLSPGILSLWSRTPACSELQNLHHDCVLFVPSTGLLLHTGLILDKTGLIMLRLQQLPQQPGRRYEKSALLEC